MLKPYERTKLRQTNVRLSPLANDVLDALVEYYGGSMTSVLELLLRDRGRELGLITPPPAIATLESVDQA